MLPTAAPPYPVVDLLIRGAQFFDSKDLTPKLGFQAQTRALCRFPPQTSTCNVLPPTPVTALGMQIPAALCNMRTITRDQAYEGAAVWTPSSNGLGVGVRGAIHRRGMSQRIEPHLLTPLSLSRSNPKSLFIGGCFLLSNGEIAGDIFGGLSQGRFHELRNRTELLHKASLSCFKAQDVRRLWRLCRSVCFQRRLCRSGGYLCRRSDFTSLTDWSPPFSRDRPFANTFHEVKSKHTKRKQKMNNRAFEVWAETRL
ncbi:hypothetical protein Nepgr_007705 [Nepenthes gracilis]|uniref:Uncharacterized protein n=1 Tax=Nepenthes gracilis TaxID=150966 RepID=A0AAD3XIP8_NEPGR|nr:hypothetical protein Nepgr_007705 [Nepenthes gracilis]